MQSLIKAWARKAEADLATARRELYVEDNPNYAAVCHFAHQGALGYLKARLIQQNVPFPQTEHLGVLLELSMDEARDWERFRPHLRSLTHLNFQLEDPECVPDAPTAAEAQSLSMIFCNHARQKLGLVSKSMGVQPRLLEDAE